MHDRTRGRALLCAAVATVLAGCAGGGVSSPESTADSVPAATFSPSPDSTDFGFPSGYTVLANAGEPPAREQSGVDVLHADLDVSVDLAGPGAYGRVTYYLVVLRTGLAELGLVLEDTSVDSVGITRGIDRIAIDVRQDEGRLFIRPRSPFSRSDTIALGIRFQAPPGLDALGPGVHFLDPAGDDPYLSTQVWAGGSLRGAWFPMWRDPADRMTSAIAITLPDSLTTLSGGQLVDQVYTEQGLRRDLWSVEFPQPSFRIGFAAGEVVLIGDTYESPVGKRSALVYAVDPELEHLTDATFAGTPHMMQVMERRTAVEYPFDEYTQAALGADPERLSTLPGTTVLGRSVLRDARARIDESGENILMRALAGQWLGSWTSIRDESDQPLLDGMTRVLEWAYLEDTYGFLRAEEARLLAREDYFEDATHLRRPVITYGADATPGDGEIKSALVLSQIGFVIGDDAWWRAIRAFVATGRPAGLVELREAVEQATRRPMTGYLDTWLLSPGHPELVVEHHYDPDTGVYSVRIRQVQDPGLFPTFEIETDFEISFEARAPYTERIRIVSRDTTLRFGASGRIAFARLDSEGRMLADVVERKPTRQWINQAELAEHVAARFDAVRQLRTAEKSADVRETLMRIAGEDPSAVVRSAALSALERYADAGLVLRYLFDRSTSDPDPACRVAAMGALRQAGDPSALAIFRRALADSSYRVVTSAIEGLAELAPESFWRAIQPVSRQRSWQGVLERAVLGALAEHPEPESADYLKRLMEPSNPEGVRLRAMTAFERLAKSYPAWEPELRTAMQSLISDRNADVRQRARQILREL